MAQSVSAKKRIRQNERRQEVNKARKTRVKTEVRKVREAVHDGDVEGAQTKLKEASRVIDQIASKGTLHKNKASRLKSRLAKRVNSAQKKG